MKTFSENSLCKWMNYTRYKTLCRWYNKFKWYPKTWMGRSISRRSYRWCWRTLTWMWFWISSKMVKRKRRVSFW